MNIGKLRHRITIQTLSLIPDGIGGYAETWSEFATVWSSVEPLNGREYFSAQQTKSKVSTKMNIRYFPGITSEMRVLFKTRIYQIETVINVNELTEEIILMCSEVV